MTKRCFGDRVEFDDIGRFAVSYELHCRIRKLLSFEKVYGFAACAESQRSICPADVSRWLSKLNSLDETHGR